MGEVDPVRAMWLSSILLFGGLPIGITRFGGAWWTTSARWRPISPILLGEVWSAYPPEL